MFSVYGKRIKILSLAEAKSGVNYDDTLLARSPYAHRISNLSWHLVDHGFATILGRGVKDEFKNYISIDPIDVSSFSLPERYVCITTGFTSETREWLPESVNGVTKWLLEKGITPVYLGKSYTKSTNNEGIVGNFKCNYDNGINLIDKTDLFEAHSIMDGALVTLGLDNGLTHLAAMSKKARIVIGYTTVDPLHRLPYREGKLGHLCWTVTPGLGCDFCQSNMNFADTKHCFTTCIYNDYACLFKMTSDKWIAQLEKALEPQTPQEKAERAYKSQQNMLKINKKLRELGITKDIKLKKDE